MTRVGLEIWNVLNEQFPEHVVWNIYKNLNVISEKMAQELHVTVMTKTIYMEQIFQEMLGKNVYSWNLPFSPRYLLLSKHYGLNHSICRFCYNWQILEKYLFDGLLQESIVNKQ